MTQQTINIGTVANDGTGDDLRVAMQKVNDNFTELYASSIYDDGIAISGNKISGTRSNDDINIVPSGTGAVTFPAVTINDNLIRGSRSNEDLYLSTSGTGNIIVEGIRINGTTLSADDSTKITLNESVDVTGTLTVGTIANGDNNVEILNLDTNFISSSDSTVIQINDGVLVTGSLQVNGSLGFFGTTPIAQQSAIAFDPLANDGSTVDDLRQIINQMLVVMRNYGLIAS